jgi:glycosyltransferase involved in cell wall biosynthesis
MTNYAPPPQLVEQVPYRDLDQMHAFARRWREEHRGQWFTVSKLSGFCLLMKREVYEAIGGLDERFGLGLFDDDDLAIRARQAGFELAVAHDLFIHHFGGRTFAGNRVDRATLFGENERRFAARWGSLAPQGERVLLRHWTEHTRHGREHPSTGGRVGQPFQADTVQAAPAGEEDGVRLDPPKGGLTYAPGPAGTRICGRSEGGTGGGLRIAWEGDFDGVQSLAIVNRAICRGLVERGHDVKMIESSARLPGDQQDEARTHSRPSPREGMSSLEDSRGVTRESESPRGARVDNGGTRVARCDDETAAQVHVRHQWPPKMEPPAHGKWVLMQPWEFGSLPKAWLPMLRRVDEVWAYSRYVRDCYLEADVPRERVHVIPLGVDPEVFRPGLEPLALAPGPEVRFLFVGGTIFPKGIDLLLTAFGRAFRAGDGVRLVIKEMGSKSFYRGQTAEKEIGELRECGYPVEYVDRDLSDAEMAGLYSACDCLVHPFRGEGFGLPIIEAMACGLPVIVTGAGPVLDYAGDETAYLIPANRGQFAECRVGEIETIGRPWLFEPAVDALVELMKRVASDRSGARAKGMAASAHIREKFTWPRTVDAVEKWLLALAHGVGQAFLPDAVGVGQAFQPDAVGVGQAFQPDAVLATPVGGEDRVRLESLTYEDAPVVVQASRLPELGKQAGRLHHKDAGRAKVSLTMIVRDEADNLPNCLRSVAGLFDEVVIVDTGSKDRTCEIAREFGARVFDFVWVDDFAAARNAALARATGDYAFWLDADDVIDPPERRRIERLIASLSACEPAAYVVKCSCDPSPNGEGGQTVVDHVRLFPLREDVRWSYRVHEQILPALRRANVPVKWTDVTVRHTGYVDKALRGRKLDRDSKILREELAERPNDPFVLFNLGSIAIERRDWRQAIECLRRSLAGSAQTDSMTRKLYALIARAHQMLGEPNQAIAACSEGLAIDPNDAELTFREAVVRRHIGDRDGAERCWRRILTLKRPDQFASVDQGIYGHLTRRNLAALARERGDHGEATKLWRAVLAECPGDPEALARLND